MGRMDEDDKTRQVQLDRVAHSKAVLAALDPESWEKFRKADAAVSQRSQSQQRQMQMQQQGQMQMQKQGNMPTSSQHSLNAQMQQARVFPQQGYPQQSYPQQGYPQQYQQGGSQTMAGGRRAAPGQRSQIVFG